MMYFVVLVCQEGVKLTSVYELVPQRSWMVDRLKQEEWPGLWLLHVAFRVRPFLSVAFSVVLLFFPP